MARTRPVCRFEAFVDQKLRVGVDYQSYPGVVRPDPASRTRDLLDVSPMIWGQEASSFSEAAKFQWVFCDEIVFPPPPPFLPPSEMKSSSYAHTWIGTS